MHALVKRRACTSAVPLNTNFCKNGHALIIDMAIFRIKEHAQSGDVSGSIVNVYIRVEKVTRYTAKVHVS